jgi:phage I-like protein
VSPVIFPMNPGAVINATSVKALMDAARRGDWTDEQKAELRALLDADRAPESQEPVAHPAPAPEAVKALAERIAALKARRLATRIDALVGGPARVGRR